MTEMIATRNAYGETLAELGEKNEKIVVLDADLSGSTRTAFFAKKFPERFFDCGIAEANMMGIAAGLATTGLIPFASTFAVFATGRTYDQIRCSIAYPKLNVKICASHSGITVGEDGATHQALEDIALMRVLPNMTVIVPSDANQTRKAVRAIAEYDGPCYLRLGRPKVPVLEEQPFRIGKANVLREGTDCTVIACGHMVSKALEAADQSEYSIRVVNMHTIKPIDKDVIIESARMGPIVTVEEHSVIGGLGSAVAEVVSQHSPTRMKIMGVNDTFGRSGKPDELLSYYHLTTDDIIQSIKEVMR
ncbi:MAG: transketolase family protein [Candidatus Diapherotrites archaeon]|nr:transketolase family protein [Candidatus Diapherotrites archaeon]